MQNGSCEPSGSDGKLRIDPKEIIGPWKQGYSLDRHTELSTMIGYNEFGHPEFDTLRSPLGELVYKLKYKQDKTVLEPIAETVAEFVREWGIQPEVVIPMPPSKQHAEQPLFMIVEALGRILSVLVRVDAVSKVIITSQM